MTKSQPSPKNKSFGVAPSPFNSLKLELAVVIVLGGFLLMALDSITQDLFLQLSILSVAGLLGMVWIMWRTQKLLKKYRAMRAVDQSPADSEP